MSLCSLGMCVPGEEGGIIEILRYRSSAFRAEPGTLPGSPSIFPGSEHPCRMFSPAGHFPAFPRRLPALRADPRRGDVLSLDDPYPRYPAPTVPALYPLVPASAGKTDGQPQGDDDDPENDEGAHFSFFPVRRTC